MGVKVLTEEQIEFIRANCMTMTPKAIALKLNITYPNVYNHFKKFKHPDNIEHTQFNRPPAIYSNRKAGEPTSYSLEK